MYWKIAPEKGRGVAMASLRPVDRAALGRVKSVGAWMRRLSVVVSNPRADQSLKNTMIARIDAAWNALGSRDAILEALLDAIQANAALVGVDEGLAVRKARQRFAMYHPELVGRLERKKLLDALRAWRNKRGRPAYGTDFKAKPVTLVALASSVMKSRVHPRKIQRVAQRMRSRRRRAG